MIRSTRFWKLLGLAAILIAHTAARAEVQVSVTITGNLDEIIPILELLRDMGIGAETLGEPGDALRLNMHSVSTIDSGIASADPGFEAVPPAPVELHAAELEIEPAPTLTNLLFTPNPAPPAGDVLVSVAVTEADKNVDTIVVQIPTVLDESFDLYDNGTHGDQVENDNVWSASFTIPEAATPGEHQATITAYDPHGEPVTVNNAEEAPLMIQGNLVIGR